MQTLGSPPTLSDNSVNVDITLVRMVLCQSVSTPNTPRGHGLYSPEPPRPCGSFSGGDSPCHVFSTPSISNMSFTKCILFHSTASFLGFFFIPVKNLDRRSHDILKNRVVREKIKLLEHKSEMKSFRS